MLIVDSVTIYKRYNKRAERSFPPASTRNRFPSLDGSVNHSVGKPKRSYKARTQGWITPSRKQQPEQVGDRRADHREMNRVCRKVGRVKARECVDDQPKMGADEGWHVGFEIVARLRVGETKEQRARFWGEDYQQRSTVQIRSHSPGAGIFKIMWRCVAGG